MSSVGATVAGVMYEFSDDSRAALIGMEGFMLLILIGAIILLIWGSVEEQHPN